MNLTHYQRISAILMKYDYANVPNNKWTNETESTQIKMSLLKSLTHTSHSVTQVYSLLHQTDTLALIGFHCHVYFANSYRLLNNTLKISLRDFNDLFLPPLYFSLSLSFPLKCLVSFPFLPPPSWWNRAHFFKQSTHTHSGCKQTHTHTQLK